MLLRQKTKLASTSLEGLIDYWLAADCLEIVEDIQLPDRTEWQILIWWNNPGCFQDFPRVKLNMSVFVVLQQLKVWLTWILGLYLGLDEAGPAAPAVRPEPASVRTQSPGRCRCPTLAGREPYTELKRVTEAQSDSCRQTHGRLGVLCARVI